MPTLFRRLLADHRGATTVEYGLVAALVAIAVIGTLTTMGGEIQRRLADIPYDAIPGTP